MKFLILPLMILILVPGITLANQTGDREIEFNYNKDNPHYNLVKSFWLEKYKDLDLTSESVQIGIDTFDIDGDGNLEIISTLNGPNYCGSGGCLIGIIKPSPKSTNKYDKIFFHYKNNTTTTFLSNHMKILSKTTNNYHDITFINNNSQIYFKWNKNRYEGLSKEISD